MNWSMAGSLCSARRNLVTGSHKNLLVWSNDQVDRKQKKIKQDKEILSLLYNSISQWLYVACHWNMYPELFHWISHSIFSFVFLFVCLSEKATKIMTNPRVPSAEDRSTTQQRIKLCCFLLLFKNLNIYWC